MKGDGFMPRRIRRLSPFRRPALKHSHAHDTTKKDFKVQCNNTLLNYSKIQADCLQPASTRSAYQGDFSGYSRVLYLERIQIFKFIPGFLKALLTKPVFSSTAFPLLTPTTCLAVKKVHTKPWLQWMVGRCQKLPPPELVLLP